MLQSLYRSLRRPLCCSSSSSTVRELTLCGCGVVPTTSLRHAGRCFLSSSSQSSQSSSSSGSNRGNLLITLGWTLLGLVAIDQALQYKHDQEAEDHRHLVAQMQQEANMDQLNVNEWNGMYDKKTPILFQCQIKLVEPMLDGTKMLPVSQLKVGDVVEVLEENIGPNRAYHLCRLPTSTNTSIGWYPTDFLERI